MDLFLYHTQDLFYYSMLCLFIVRIILNAIIYDKIDSHIIHANIPYFWTMIPFSEKEKEEKRKSNPEIKDFSKDGGEGAGYEAFLQYAFTFWWPIEHKEEINIIRLKNKGNIFNVVFIILLLFCVFLFIYMQDVNMKYYNVKEDWLYLFR